MNHQYAFVVSTGRCGTTSLGILLQESQKAVVLNEGQLRDEHLGGEQVLKAMTMQNYTAYKEPRKAKELLSVARESQIEEVLKRFDKEYFIELSYYLSPFVGSIHELYPNAKIVYIYRDGRTFLRSAYTAEIPDPAPVGYLDPRKLSPKEKFVAMGRLRPLPGDPLFESWKAMPPFEKNVWLWRETNRLIQEQLEVWPKEQVLTISMEAMFQEGGIKQIVEFLGLDDIPDEKIKFATSYVTNSRSEHVIPHWPEWSDEQKRCFKNIGQDMLEKLQYVKNDHW